MSASPNGGEELSVSLDALERDLNGIRQQQAAYRRFMTLSVVCIIVLMLGFGWLLFGSVRRNLNREELAAAASQRWETLRPQLEAKLSNATLAAMPAYREMAMQRLPVVGPQLREQIESRLQAFPQRVEQEITSRVDGMLKRVAVQNAADAKEVFPALSDQQAINVAETLEAEMLAQGVELNAHLDQRLQGEQQKLQTVLTKFDTSAVATKDRETIERDFVHGLIQLMDFELMTDDPLDAETVSLPPIEMPVVAEPIEPEPAGATESPPATTTQPAAETAAASTRPS